MPNQKKHASKPQLRLFIGAIIFIISLGFFIKQFHAHLDDLKNFHWSYHQWSSLIISSFVFFLNILFGAFLWIVLVRESSPHASSAKLFYIFLMAQLAKYLPGNIGQHVARVYMAKSADVSMSSAVQSMLFEALLGIAVGSMLALTAFYYFFAHINFNSTGLNPAIFAIIAFLALLLPWLIIAIVNRFPRIAKKLSGNDRLSPPSFIATFLVSLLFLACFLAIGFMLKIQLSGIFNIPSASWIELTAAFSLIWMIGYLTPGAPAGLGVREALMILLLGPIYGEAIAVGLSVTFRISTTFGDALAFIVGLLLKKTFNSGKIFAS